MVVTLARCGSVAFVGNCVAVGLTSLAGCRMPISRQPSVVVVTKPNTTAATMTRSLCPVRS